MMFAAPAMARTSLGTFDGWGAFRDETPLRCYAIAEPVRGGGGNVRPFASISNWPRAGVRGQLHIRLRRAAPVGAPVVLVMGERRFALVGSGSDAWAADAVSDEAIVARIRDEREFAVEVRGHSSEIYALKGAATAIDAAALGCVRR